MTLATDSFAEPYGRSLAGIAGRIPSGVKDVCLLSYVLLEVEASVTS